MGKSLGRKERNHRFVYKRDAWMCRMPVCYCPDGRQLDPALAGQDDPWAPSIDHIVPRALGGSDARPNLRAAHKLCNVRHGNRLSILLNPQKVSRDTFSERPEQVADDQQDHDADGQVEQPAVGAGEP